MAVEIGHPYKERDGGCFFFSLACLYHWVTAARASQLGKVEQDNEDYYGVLLLLLREEPNRCKVIEAKQRW